MAESKTIRIARWGLIGIAGIYTVMLLIPQFQPGGFRPDFAVFWTAAQLEPAHVEQLYDAQAMTAAQSWLTNPSNGLRPFAYPPTALLLFRPFGTISFPVAFLIWTLISLAVFAMAARHFVARKALALSLISPPVALALATGQTSMLSAGAMMGAISILERRPILAGVILGAATALKPQTLILAPLALIVAQQWRALLAWGVSGLVLVLATVVLWGKQVWFDWLASLSGFSAIVSRLGLDTEGVTPLSFAKSAGLAAWPALAIQSAAIIAGCVLVIWAFRQPEKTTRLVALAAGSLLCAPYALMYDLSVLMPVAAALLLSGRATGLFAGFALTGLAGVGALPAVIASTLTQGSRDRTGTPT